MWWCAVKYTNTALRCGIPLQIPLGDFKNAKQDKELITTFLKKYRKNLVGRTRRINAIYHILLKIMRNFYYAILI